MLKVVKKRVVAVATRYGFVYWQDSKFKEMVYARDKKLGRCRCGFKTASKLGGKEK
ncbi:hypothetical protein [Hydrogenimonas thermophila]|uniref:hypothetical protein n=1 Tax=Hydrogenimonas thermophila TaxID=223786 RepID=UPI0015A5B143|nr:hypothetical protein [Hydrogenimonas thermophila]